MSLEREPSLADCLVAYLSDWLIHYPEDVFEPVRRGETEVSPDRVAAHMARHVLRRIIADIEGGAVQATGAALLACRDWPTIRPSDVDGTPTWPGWWWLDDEPCSVPSVGAGAFVVCWDGTALELSKVDSRRWRGPCTQGAEPAPGYTLRPDASLGWVYEGKRNGRKNGGRLRSDAVASTWEWHGFDQAKGAITDGGRTEDWRTGEVQLADDFSLGWCCSNGNDVEVGDGEIDELRDRLARPAIANVTRTACLAVEATVKALSRESAIRDAWLALGGMGTAYYHDMAAAAVAEALGQASRGDGAHGQGSGQAQHLAEFPTGTNPVKRLRTERDEPEASVMLWGAAAIISAWVEAGEPTDGDGRAAITFDVAKVLSPYIESRQRARADRAEADLAALRERVEHVVNGIADARSWGGPTTYPHATTIEADLRAALDGAEVKP